jgi:hypothetical protein
LSDAGWTLLAETVEESVTENYGAGATYTIEWWPLLQHKDSDNVSGRRPEAARAVELRAGGAPAAAAVAAAAAAASATATLPLRAAIESNRALQAALVETPCLFVGDHTSTRKLSPASGSTPVVAFVVRGSLIAVEPYFPDVGVEFPAALAPSGQSRLPPTSGTCPALKQLQNWLEDVTAESLTERSFAACVMLHPSKNPQQRLTFSLLNVAPLDAVDSQHFAWSDLVGLIVQIQNRREQAAALSTGTSDTDAGDGERPSHEQGTGLQQRTAAGAAPPRAEVVFRGTWSVWDESSVSVAEESVAAPARPAAVAAVTTAPAPAEKAAARLPSPPPRSASSSHQDPAAAAPSSFSTTALIAGAAVVACVASAAIGVGLGMKMSGKK